MSNSESLFALYVEALVEFQARPAPDTAVALRGAYREWLGSYLDEADGRQACMRFLDAQIGTALRIDQREAEAARDFAESGLSVEAWANLKEAERKAG